MTTIVRIANEGDLSSIVTMQVNHRAEVGMYSELSFNEELCTENMAAIIAHPLHLILVACDKETKAILGYVWLVEFSPHYSEDFYHSEVYSYVVPSARGASVLARLISKSKIISKFSGAKYLQYGSFSGNKQLSEAYHKRYELVGEVFRIQL